MRSSMSDLPSHIILDILSRLPTKYIIHCRCVCKTWRNLVSHPYFANLHLSRSPTSLILTTFSKYSKFLLDVVELEDEPDHHRLLWDTVMRFDLGVGFQNVVGSINGLVCLRDFGCGDETTWICNPIMREYVTLPKPKYKGGYPAVVVFGFGFSSRTGQYKVVRIWQFPMGDSTAGDGSASYKSEGEVYTLGTSGTSWKSIGHVPFLHHCRLNAVSFKDKIHWLVSEQDHASPGLICCFDIDTELFQSIPVPPLSSGTQSLGVLEGCLCVCDHCSTSLDTVIWVMKAYGVKESWRKEIVIKKFQEWFDYEMFYPLKVLKDGGVLIAGWDQVLLCFINSEIVNEASAYTQGDIEAMLHVSSFLSLRDIVKENVVVF